MRHIAVELWVVYNRPMKGCPDGIRAICEQSEWQAMELAKPGYYTLIQAGIVNEGEAERLARGTYGEKPRKNSRRSIISWPDETAPIAKEQGPSVVETRLPL